MPCWELTVSGRVQGVGFRYYTRQQAHHYGITGYVRNLPDGKVKIVACGSEEMLEAFRREIRQGNRMAVVTQIDTAELVHHSEYEDFVIA